MAIIAKFGTAPEYTEQGYKMVTVAGGEQGLEVTGTKEEAASMFDTEQDIVLVTGPEFHQKPGKYHFYVMAR